MIWQKQTQTQPLYNDFLWSRPETKQQGCRLLIVGGSRNNFMSLSIALMTAKKFGAAEVKVLMPEAAKKFTGNFPEAIFAPSTLSGGFSKDSFNMLVAAANWSNSVLLLGDMDKGSESSILLEKFLVQYQGIMTVCRDSIELFSNPKLIFDRQDAAITINFRNLQKLWPKLSLQKPILNSDPLTNIINKMYDFGKTNQSAVIMGLDDIVVASHQNELVSQSYETAGDWQLGYAIKLSILWGEQPQKLKEALACSLIDLDNGAGRETRTLNP